MKQPIPFGKYYLLERINVGGMAEVFRAKAYGVEGFERLVAVKRILPNIAEDKEFIGMFIDEAKIAVQLNHANIAQIFDLGRVESSYYIALEHIHGRDLRAIYDRCNERFKPMPIAQAAFVIMKVCEGLDYAHNKRDQSGRELHLVHRDVSPQNILVSFEGEVKLIDFGIAKAAGKGAKTQAGILKGKFGYMSPEQVRGLPIDRRSDIFSCGIVLYELLTGERLFVGESDFSTLEKVRNVEILPPSTYNRKIPEELERIVLKALAKDVEDRYQNAIDLHDELQAFVYMAGEFYSRKDLASWMKETFAREIEDETAKLESYRHFRPPEVKTPSMRVPQQTPSAPHRSTLSMASMAKPPPLPPSMPGNSGAMPGQGHEAVRARSYSGGGAGPGEGLSWDDDELETQIYDTPPDEAPDRMVARGTPMAVGPGAIGPASTAPLGSLASGPGVTGPMGQSMGQMPSPVQVAPPQSMGPVDVVAMSSTSRGWAAGPGAAGHAGHDTAASSGHLMPPPKLAVGSNPAPSPFAPAPVNPVETGVISNPLADEPSAFAPFGTIGPGDSMITPRKSRTGLIVFLAALLLVGGGGAGAYFLFFDKSEKEGDGVAATDEPASPDQDTTGTPGTTLVTPPQTTGAAALAVPDAGVQEISPEVLARTGFKLIVLPTQAEVELDGKPIGANGLIQLLNVQPGAHELVVKGPPGFFAKQQTIQVVAGKVETYNIKLDALDISATFDSNPPKATVTLIEDETNEIELGQTPATHKLDPYKTYKVRFEKRGYKTETQTVNISGTPTERVAAVLEKERTRVVKNNDSDDGSSEGGVGTLMLNSKPVCKILIDGKDTGKNTPQRQLELPAGRHKITLVNEQFGIDESFSVTIKAGETVKRFKDLSDRLR